MKTAMRSITSFGRSPQRPSRCSPSQNWKARARSSADRGGQNEVETVIGGHGGHMRTYLVDSGQLIMFIFGI